MKQQHNGSDKNSSVVRLTWTHKFLNKKYWHPQNPRNLEKKWLAEEKQRQEKLINEKAAEELQEEKKYWESIQKLDEKNQIFNAKQRSVAFLYMKPPGYADQQDVQSTQEKKTADNSVTFCGAKPTMTQSSLLEGYIWSSKHIPGDKVPRGGYSSSDPNQQLLLPSQEELEGQNQNLARASTQKYQQKCKGYKLLQLSKLERQKLKKIVKREIKKRRSHDKSSDVTSIFT